MRIADKMNFDQVKSNLSRNRAEMSDLQNQAATQKRLNKPSDDPLAATRVLAARTEINGAQQFLKNVNQAKTFLEYSDQSLSELTESLIRAKELAVGQSSDATANEQSRRVTASEIEQIRKQSAQIGNRKLGDRFLFGGYRTTRSPFDQDGHYFGDSGEIEIIINKEASVAMNLPGNRVFLGTEKKAPAEPGPDPSQNFSPRPPESGAETPQGEPPAVSLRGPASVNPNTDEPVTAAEREDNNLADTWKAGVNVFHVLKELETGLKTNDKESIQESLDQLDAALAQVILARSQLGSRLMTLNSALESLQKTQIDAKTMASNMEDADTFELVSDLNKSESTLRASLATSGKLIQPSLLDFLR